MDQLLDLFNQLDAMPFGKIQQLHGTYRINRFELTFLRIQGSPGAHPGSIGELSFNPVHFIPCSLVRKCWKQTVYGYQKKRYDFVLLSASRQLQKAAAVLTAARQK